MKITAVVFFVLITSSFGKPNEERIANGNEMTKTVLEKFNYQVGLLSVNVIGIKTLCGGTLIHPKVVLTAAHCVFEIAYVAVFMGSIVRPTNPDANGNIIVLPKDIVCHIDYSRNGMKNDIAIINLPNAVTLSKYIGTIKLASYKWARCDDGYGWISGWGKTNNSDNSLATVLNYLEVEAYYHDFCQEKYFNLIPKQQLCTSSYDSEGLCQGDSGGPYVMENDSNGERYLCGIVSFTLSLDCINKLPKVYTSVGYYNDNGWICANSNGLVGCA